MITVKHRRAALATWEAIDPIIPDGELALTKKTTGVEIMVGDGSSRYSELLPINGRRTLNYALNVSTNLEDGDEVHCGYPDSIEIELNPRGSDFFTALISFSTGDYCIPITISYDGDIFFTGNDIFDGYFEPDIYKHYTVLFWYDGIMNCHVRGVYVD